MKPDRWKRIEDLYNRACDLAPEEQDAFLRTACGTDEKLFQEVRRLLDENSAATEFLEDSSLMPSQPPKTDWVGELVGPYEFVSFIGAGGMGQVFRARDLRLKRDVAIKILPPEFSRNTDRVKRFQREAEVLAALNHPNIAAIYDLEEAQDAKFLVLELVEGETLAERIARGPIPVEESLRIAISICEALEAAHEKGIIHRDLKPANVKLTPDGKVKVLDFGLAKPVREARPVPLTEVTGSAAVFVGTAAYVPPEQANGKEADRRSDVWAFGGVLFEMLTGRRAFSGETVAEILANVLKSEPDWSLVSESTPRNVRRVLQLCLQKDRAERIRDIGDVRLELLDKSPENAAHQRRSASKASWIVAVVSFLIALALGGTLYVRQVPASQPEMRLDINVPAGTTSFVLSPDGKKIAFVASSDGERKLSIRDLSSGAVQPISGTTGAANPFWWPDSRTVSFYVQEQIQLKSVDIASGAIKTLFPDRGGTGAVNAEGIFLLSRGGKLRQISAAGLESSVSWPDFSWPQFLPDNRHFLTYTTAFDNLDNAGVYVAQLNSPDKYFLLNADIAASFMPPDQILFVKQNTLYAQTVDTGTWQIRGEPVPVAKPVSSDVNISVAPTGLIAYRSGTSIANLRQLAWYTREGKLVEIVGKPGRFNDIEMSPDGKWLSMGNRPEGNPQDIWLLELSRGTMTRFTFGPRNNVRAVWSPDGSRIVYTANQQDLVVKRFGSNEKEELLIKAPPDAQGQAFAASDWSRDGKFLLYENNGGTDLWARQMIGEEKTLPVANTNFRERTGKFSPDAHWVAYISNESGRFEVYVQQFPAGGSRRQVSTEGGMEPRWRNDGKELFYVSANGDLMATPITLSANGQSIEIGKPSPLFQTHLGGPSFNEQYVVSPDGQRFLMVVANQEALNSPISLIVNWKRPK